jgi:hypothetical protein
MVERKTITGLYIRICADSGYSLEFDRAAALAGNVLGIHPLEVYNAIGVLSTMQKIAVGDHPACPRKAKA